jgi:hypothetical protein
VDTKAEPRVYGAKGRRLRQISRLGDIQDPGPLPADIQEKLDALKALGHVHPERQLSLIDAAILHKHWAAVRHLSHVQLKMERIKGNLNPGNKTAIQRTGLVSVSLKPGS